MGEEVNFEVINRDVLLVLPVIDKMTPAGIIKSDAQLKAEQAKQDQFLVAVEVGNDCQSIRKGDKVLIGNGKHPQIELDGKLYLIINELAILGKRKD